MKREVTILEGNTFVVSDTRGDIDASPTEPHGLFHQDTRYLSRWRLTLDGAPLTALSVDDLDYFAARHFLVAGTGTIYVDSEISVLRTRAVGDGFHEDLLLLSHAEQPRDLVLRIEAGCDFADLFEVKDAQAKKGQCYRSVDGGRLLLGYRREQFVRETVISASAPSAVDEHGFTFHVQLPPHGQWSTCLDVVAASGSAGAHNKRPKYGHGDLKARPQMGESLQSWCETAPELITSFRPLHRIYERSIVDLAALRFFVRVLPGAALPAAGLPWFMAIFGRDSILTSLQALPFAPGLAATTLRALGRRQGVVVDHFRDEEPGKILHEMRFGELTAFEERPHSPYYGAADSTPLWLVLLDEYERWTGDAALVRELEPNARAALDWIDDWGDHDGDGYVDYQRRRDTGLENQCWKDSWNSIQFSDGSISKLPRACCEIQGYVYDAKRRVARLARELWGDAALGQRLEADAAELRRRFNRDFWMPERQFFALALDGDHRQVDALTSNVGHLLWSGIVDEDKAERCAETLMGSALFSGWGVRTMAEGEGGYNPVGYHVGTVWPHDNAIVAAGLRRYHHHADAARIAFAMLEAASHFDGRLPEAFAGYPRALTSYPVEYPTACSPQAWATGAPLSLLRTLLGLEPLGEHLVVEPALPEELEQLALLGVTGRWGSVDAFGRAVRRGAYEAEQRQHP
jgi:glycogen debranching enzyme